jgi:hypothetical protein
MKQIRASLPLYLQRSHAFSTCTHLTTGDLEKGSKSQRVDSNPALPFQNLYPLQQLKLRKPIKLRQTYSVFTSQQTQAQAEHHSHRPETTFSSDPVLCYKYKSDELKDDNHRLQARETHEVTRSHTNPSKTITSPITWYSGTSSSV